MPSGRADGRGARECLSGDLSPPIRSRTRTQGGGGRIMRWWRREGGCSCSLSVQPSLSLQWGPFEASSETIAQAGEERSIYAGNCLAWYVVSAEMHPRRWVTPATRVAGQGRGLWSVGMVLLSMPSSSGQVWLDLAIDGRRRASSTPPNQPNNRHGSAACPRLRQRNGGLATDAELISRHATLLFDSRSRADPRLHSTQLRRAGLITMAPFPIVP